MDTAVNLFFAVEILRPSDEIQSVLKDHSIETYPTDEGQAIRFDNADYDAYEEMTDKMETETLQLGILNIDDGQFYARKELTQLLADEGGVEETDIDLSFLQDLADFVDNHEEEIDSAIKDVTDTFYGYAGLGDNYDVDPANGLDGEQPDNNQNEEPVDNNNNKPSQASYDPYADLDAQEEAKQPVANGEVEQDPLLQLAAQQVANADKNQFPVFDEYTERELANLKVGAYDEIEKSTNKITYELYHRFQEAKPELEESFKARFKESQDRHDETLKTLDNNETALIEKITNTNQDEYDAAKNAWVEAQKPSLLEQYDAEHKEDFNKSLTADINKIKLDIETQRREENREFDKFKQEEHDKFIKNQLERVKFDDLVEKHNQTVNEEVDKLMEAASDFADQVALLTKQHQDNANDAKQKQLMAETKLESFKEQLASRVKEETARQVQQETLVLNNEVLAKQKEVENEQKQKQMLENQLKQVENERDTLKDEKEELEKFKAQINAQLEDLKNRPAPEPQVVQVPVPQTPAPSEPTKENNVGWIVTVGVAILFGLTGTGFGVYALGHNSSSSQPTTVVATSPSSSSSSSSSSTKYKAGDTWTYHSNVDGQDHTVKMDNATTGHYTDTNGQEQTIVLSSNN